MRRQCSQRSVKTFAPQNCEERERERVGGRGRSGREYNLLLTLKYTFITNTCKIQLYLRLIRSGLDCVFTVFIHSNKTLGRVCTYNIKLYSPSSTQPINYNHSLSLCASVLQTARPSAEPYHNQFCHSSRQENRPTLQPVNIAPADIFDQRPALAPSQRRTHLHYTHSFKHVPAIISLLCPLCPIQVRRKSRH